MHQIVIYQTKEIILLYHCYRFSNNDSRCIIEHYYINEASPDEHVMVWIVAKSQSCSPMIQLIRMLVNHIVMILIAVANRKIAAVKRDSAVHFGQNSDERYSADP